MSVRSAVSLAVLLGLLLCQDGAVADGVAMTSDGSSAGHITGFGGIFFKSKDPKKLAAWYRDVLGLPIESWGGAMLRTDAPGHPEVVVWNAFSDTTDYMAPSTRDFMVNFAVDDLDALLAKLKAHGVTILKRDDTDANGKFAWILDPDGTKIELWQPNKP
ncbi:MAG: VOC family protein [Rhizomicrobium sp.]|jgi:catechol 2,3-dioxygenase-like lactoylglutathione lyase family enzyme